MLIQDTPVAVSSLPVGGEEISSERTLEIRSPWSGELVGSLPVVGAAEAHRAIGAADVAMRLGLPTHQRAGILDRAAELVRQRRDQLARLLAMEVAKPLNSAYVEIDRGIQTLTFSAEAARSLAGVTVPIDAHPSGSGHLGFTLRVPVGVVAAITPFNFPFNLAAHKVGPAIAAGCACVLKPSFKAPLSGLEFARILHQAGLPKPWLSVINGEPAEIAEVFLTDPRVKLITFTGSSSVGWSLSSRAGARRICLELGNSTPVIVCADADLEAAAQAIAASAFGFAGQSCISTQRVLVESSVHDGLVQALVAQAERHSYGDPLGQDVTVSALIDAGARARVGAAVEGAIGAGARQLCGGPAGDGNLLPTVLDGVSPGMDVWDREVFGPVAGIMAFEAVDQALELANGTEYGLQAAIFTNHLPTAMLAAQRLRFGGVMVNESPSFRVDQMPYGGVKTSGNTKEGPGHAVLEMTEERLVVIRL